MCVCMCVCVCVLRNMAGNKRWVHWVYGYITFRVCINDLEAWDILDVGNKLLGEKEMIGVLCHDSTL